MWKKKRLDGEKSLLNFPSEFSERSARGRASSGEAARREKRGRQPKKRKEPLPSSAQAFAWSFFCLERFQGLREKERLLVV